MSDDLVKRLRDGCNLQQRDGERAADRIEQLERGLKAVASAEPMTATEILQGRKIDQLERELAAEKALADQIYEALFFDRTIQRYPAIAAYRKARGL